MRLKVNRRASTISSWHEGIRDSGMNVSVKGDYALHAIFDLALQEPGEPIKIADIARRQKIPQKFLELILAGLKQGGFVESRRGAEGGYLLSRAPDAITVGEVLRYVEGAKSNKPARKLSAGDPFTEIWRRAESAISNVLDRATFAELVRNWRERQTKYVPNWEI
jgi:Rrf2 family transcriptional regulator, cysteine metabolism repressor